MPPLCSPPLLLCGPKRDWDLIRADNEEVRMEIAAVVGMLILVGLTFGLIEFCDRA